jgi:heme oxygenase
LSIRLVLRAATSEDHAALEATPLMQVLSSCAPTPAQYLEYLSRQRDLHVALEAVLAPWLPVAWGSERLIKRYWLESDIRALLPTRSALPVPVPIRLHCIASLAEALGTLYVLEGSTLGLRMIENRLPPGHPGLGSAGRFIRGYGESHGLRWRTFLDSLEALPAQDWPQATAAARATFRIFLAHFAGSEQAICGAE